MKRILAVFLLCVAGAVSAQAQTTPQPTATQPPESKADALPTVDQILARYIEALGGRATLEKFSSTVTKGTIEFPSLGVSGAIEILEKAPNKQFVSVQIAGAVVSQQGVAGESGWVFEPETGARDMRPLELAEGKREAEFFKPLNLKQLYAQLTVAGVEKLDQGDAYVLQAIPAQGAPEKLFFDSKSGLLVRAVIERKGKQGKVVTETSYENYKEVEGLKQPMTIHRTSPRLAYVLRVKQVKRNVVIDDAKFSKPAAP